jgi:hypothetical protein
MGKQTNVLKLIEDYKIIIKEKGDWEKNWHLIVPFFFFMVGIFNKKKKEDFYGRYFTTLGRTIYVPNIEHFYLRVDSYEALIRHEHQHMIDIKGWKERILYIVSKKHRLWYESRGYFWNLYTELKNEGFIRPSNIDHVVDQLTGDMYNNMTTFSKARRIVGDLVNKSYMMINTNDEILK